MAVPGDQGGSGSPTCSTSPGRPCGTPSAIQVEDNRAPVPFWRVIGTAVLINLLNPKLTIFFFALLPQFVPAGQPNGTWRMMGLNGVFMALTFVVFALYGVFAARVRTQVISRPKVMLWLRRTFGATYVLFAGRLAAES
jgi:threonine/homoserine/homoserine lactone efflux protein